MDRRHLVVFAFGLILPHQFPPFPFDCRRASFVTAG
jgi:hypothetical protein